ncbi:hypothetical protein L6452_20029 [Arctium lappa]|uniref:Uncharacterized protein n=1 Tax=Arctium lappa TaxID=4217 RepID=A0ACB9BA97_ARCLA|nr:hypothetical protein L6452_20029 [Arctium lappa]
MYIEELDVFKKKQTTPKSPTVLISLLTPSRLLPQATVDLYTTIEPVSLSPLTRQSPFSLTSSLSVLRLPEILPPSLLRRRSIA